MHFSGTDIFTGKKYFESEMSHKNMRVPIVSKEEYDLIDIDNEGYLSIVSEDGIMR